MPRYTGATGTGPVYYAACVVCGKRRASTELLADLDGEPFKAYVCREGTCQDEYEQRQRDRERDQSHKDGR